VKKIGIGIFLLGMLFTLLVGCKSGTDDIRDGETLSSSSSSSSSAEGLWEGITSTSRSITGLVLDDGVFYFLYSSLGDPLLIGGVVQGNLSTSGGQIISSNAIDYNFEGAGINSGTLSGSVVAKQSLNGSALYTDVGITTFTSTYNADYELTPSIAELVGTYTGVSVISLGTENSTVTISSDGSFSGLSDGGCVFNGSVSRRGSGNVFNSSISFAATGCHFTSTLTGIAYFDSAEKRIYFAVQTADRSDGILFTGVKP